MKHISMQWISAPLSVALVAVVIGIGHAWVWPSQLSAQVNLTTHANWKAFELVTQGDNISSIADPGYGTIASRGKYDGLGAYRSQNTLFIQLNHETSAAAISRVDLDITNFKLAIQSTNDEGQTNFPSSIKTGMGYAYRSIFDGSYHAINNPNPVASGTIAVGQYGDDNFSRFCSGTAYRSNSFGIGHGFADDIYLAGEENFDLTGKFYALNQATRQLWEVPSFGSSSWEASAMIDTGNETHVALMLNSDSASSSTAQPLRLYVGEKNVDVNNDGAIDFLERNGLRGGQIHYFQPDDGYSTTDLPDGIVSGTWTTDDSQALREAKLEDIHTNPMNGRDVVFADQTDGVYRIDLEQLVFDENGLDLNNTTTVIRQIIDDDSPPIGAPDNLTWSLDGHIYVQEDGDGNGLFRLTPEGTGILEFATAFSEPSGIIDISEWVDYQPGSVFLTSVMGDGSSGAQLVTLVSPTAIQSIPEPGLSAALLALIFVTTLCLGRNKRVLQ